MTKQELAEFKASVEALPSTSFVRQEMLLVIDELEAAWDAIDRVAGPINDAFADLNAYRRRVTW